MPNDLQQVYNYFTKDFRISDKSNTPEAREARDKELEFMCYNEGLMYTACQVYTNETTQADSQDRVIGIKASKKATEKHFYNWLQKIGLNNNMLNSLAWDIVLFGNAFYIKSVDLAGAGITGITPIDQSECKDVIEFQGTRVKKAMASSSSYHNLVNRYDSIKKLSQLFSKDIMTTDYSLWYKPYLFGYQIGDNVLPPWAVSHLRRYTTASEFYPYGRPLFIGSLSRYKSFKTTEMLVDLARPASFPTKVMEIQGHEDMTETELFQKINQIRQMYSNITEQSKNKDELSVGEMLFTVKGVVEYQQHESRIDLNQLGDLDAKRTDLILSTGIPEGYLDSSKQNWGQSGNSLIQQSKIVSRNVYPCQTAFIEALAQDYKIHLMLTGELDGEDTEFEIYMNFPVVEDSSDKQRSKSDSIRLANDILSNLGTSLGLDRGEALPAEVVADVFGKYSFLDMEEIADWVDLYLKGQEIEENYEQVTFEDEKERKEYIKESKRLVAERNALLRSLNTTPTKKLTEKVNDRLSEEVLREVYFTTKRTNNLLEGATPNGKHYVMKKVHEEVGSVFNMVKEERDSRGRRLNEISNKLV